MGYSRAEQCARDVVAAGQALSRPAAGCGRAKLFSVLSGLSWCAVALFNFIGVNRAVRCLVARCENDPTLHLLLQYLV